MRNEFTAVYARDGDWIVAWVQEVPGALTQGRTIEEARENLQEAISMMLESLRERSDADPCAPEILRERITVAPAARAILSA